MREAFEQCMMFFGKIFPQVKAKSAESDRNSDAPKVAQDPTTTTTTKRTQKQKSFQEKEERNLFI